MVEIVEVKLKCVMNFRCTNNERVVIVIKI